MLKVAVMFGGKSVEHEVSIITGLQVIENMNKEKYEPIPVYVGRDGRWYTGKDLLDISNYKDIPSLLKKCEQVVLPPVPGLNKLYYYPFRKKFMSKEYDYIDVDVIFPAFHGTHGEDGTMQGLFQLANIPYVGSGVVGSATGMDKVIMKDIFKANNLPIVNYLWFLRKEYEKNKEAMLDLIESKLKYPMFVKPANLGSSIGISKAKNRDELFDAIEIAIYYDRKIIVEEAVKDPMEVNCSVMGIDKDLGVSLCEMPVPWEEFLSYQDKYMRKEKGGKGSTTRQIPAPIPEEKTKEIQELAKKVFQILDCSGLARIDFLLEKETMKVYVNEINTIPGSFAFYLWKPLGISFEKLIDKLIEYAVERHKEYARNMYTFETTLLLKAADRGTKM